MQQFTVPQFIDVEDKIMGPLTTRQFIIILAGALLIAICYKLFDFSLFVTMGIMIILIFGTFAFIKINGRPFHYFILNLVQTFKRSRLRVWDHLLGKIEADYEIEEDRQAKQVILPPAKHYTTSRLAELSLIVDTRGAYRGEVQSGSQIKIN